MSNVTGSDPLAVPLNAGGSAVVTTGFSVTNGTGSGLLISSFVALRTRAVPARVAGSGVPPLVSISSSCCPGTFTNVSQPSAELVLTLQVWSAAMLPVTRYFVAPHANSSKYGEDAPEYRVTMAPP